MHTGGGGLLNRCTVHVLSRTCMSPSRVACSVNGAVKSSAATVTVDRSNSCVAKRGRHYNSQGEGWGRGGGGRCDCSCNSVEVIPSM